MEPTTNPAPTPADNATTGGTDNVAAVVNFEWNDDDSPAPVKAAPESQASDEVLAAEPEPAIDYLEVTDSDLDTKFKWGEIPVSMRELREAYESRTEPARLESERKAIAQEREAISKAQGQYAYLKDREDPIKYMTGYLNDLHTNGVDVKELHAVLNEALTAAIQEGRIDPKAYADTASANQKQRELETEKANAQREITQYRLQAQIAQVIAKHSDLAKADPKTGDMVIKPEVAQKILGHVEATFQATGKMLTISEAATELVSKKAFAAPAPTRRQLADEYRKQAPAKTSNKKEALTIEQATQQFYK